MRRSGGLVGFKPPRAAGNSCQATGDGGRSGEQTVQGNAARSRISPLQDATNFARPSVCFPAKAPNSKPTIGDISDLLDDDATPMPILPAPSATLDMTIPRATSKPTGLSFIRPSANSLTASSRPPAVLANRSISGATNPAAEDKESSQARAFTVMYTKKSTKKRKTFSDGVIVVREGKLVLYDSEGKQVSQTRVRVNEEVSRWGAGSQVDVGTQEVEVVASLDYQVFLSGKAFLSGASSTVTAGTSTIRSLPKFTSVSATSSRSVATVTSSTTASMFDANAENALVLMRGEEQLGTCDIVVDPSLSRVLRPHQREGVRFMFECVTGMREKHFNGRGCVLADEMGLGKSLQAITLIWTLVKQGPKRGGASFARKAVIVCPASLVDNWCREVAKFLGPAKLRPIAVTEAGAEAEKNVEEFVTSRVRPLLIISYETYRKHCERLNRCPGLDLLICDEGHRLKSAQGNKTIAALSAVPTVKRIILTGTPLQNQLDEFFAVISFVNPNVLGRDAKHFKRVFQIPIERGRDKTATREEKETADARSTELQRLTEQFVLRRTAEVNRSLLPPKRETNVFIRLASGEQKDRYVSFIKSKQVQDMFSNTGQSADALRLVTRLKQLCTHPMLLGDDLSGLDLLSSSGKFQFLDVLLNETRQEDPTNRIVLVSSFTSTLDLLARLCDLRRFKYLRLDGTTKVKERQRLVNRFNAFPSTEDDPFVFLLSSKAGGCGLNLIGANRLVLVDPDWNPAVDLQAMARVWRDGQTKPVVVYRLFATGTIEERVFQRQMMKAHTAGGILSSTSGATSESVSGFSRAELKKLFELKLNTDCDTFDMLQEEEGKGQGSLAKRWERYQGPASVVGDDVLKRTCQRRADEVSWVQSELFDGSTSQPVLDDELADAEVKELDEGQAFDSADEGEEEEELDLEPKMHRQPSGTSDEDEDDDFSSDSTGHDDMVEEHSMGLSNAEADDRYTADGELSKGPKRHRVVLDDADASDNGIHAADEEEETL